MSDSHVDKDKTAIVNYDEVLKAFAVGSAASLIAGPIGVVGASGWFLSAIYKAVKEGKESKPTLGDADILHKIIETGREQGLSELFVEIDDSTVVNIGVGTSEIMFEGVKIDLGIKRGNRRKIRIKY